MFGQHTTSVRVGTFEDFYMPQRSRWDECAGLAFLICSTAYFHSLFFCHCCCLPSKDLVQGLPAYYQQHKSPAFHEHHRKAHISMFYLTYLPQLFLTLGTNHLSHASGLWPGAQDMSGYFPIILTTCWPTLFQQIDKFTK